MFLVKKILVAAILLLSLTFCKKGDKEDSYPYYKTVEDEFSNHDTSKLYFFVIGDWGMANDAQKQVAKAMAYIAKHVKPAFVITVGDNFYESGVQSSSDPIWKTHFEDIYSDSALQIPWYPALGNHDYEGNIAAQIEYSKNHSDWHMPSEYYSFTKTIDPNVSVKFIILDTEGIKKQYGDLEDTTDYINNEQYQWCKQELENATEKWIIVVGHHPVYSSGLHGNNYFMLSFNELFKKYKVDFYFSGHDHDFEHSKTPASSTDYIVTGAGASIRAIGKNKNTVVSISHLGFNYISISENQANLYFITNNNEVIYKYARSK